jgi:hypothetical protein
MSNWSAIDPNQLLPNVFTSAVKAATGALSGALGDAADAFSLPTLPTIPSLPNASDAVIKAILSTIKTLVTGSGVHVIAIPVAKTVPPQPIAIPPTLRDLQTTLQITLGPTDTVAADAYAKLLNSKGGNAGFFKTFAASLIDVQDPNRPRYEKQTDAVFMAVLLAGSPRYHEITAAASVLDQLTRPKGGNGLAARTVPIPQNLKARVAGRGVAVRLDWDPPPATFLSPYFPGVTSSVNRYAVIRSSDAKAQSARSVLDFFPTQTLTEGMTSGNAKVVAIGSGKNSSYLDTDGSIDPTKPVYYCVAWEVNAQEPNTKNVLPFDRVSNVSKLTPRAPTPPQTGTAPDWTAVASSIDTFPTLANAASLLVEQAKVLLDAQGPSSSDKLNAALGLAQDSAKRLAARSTELVNDVNRLATSLSRPIPSLYVTQMSSSKGGNAFLLSELSKRLNDASDGSRPPFDHGEYVCGVCFVAGSPRLADLASIIAFFNALFGPASASNPLLGLLAAIDTPVTQAETAVFQTNMVQFPAGTDLTNINPATGQPVVPVTPVTANDGTPVATDSPQNPNAGDTNVTPVSEIC